jgi:hypothetical protein
MAHLTLPGDTTIFHRRYTDKFNSWYGEGIDAKQIYIHCGNNFVKFHAVFPAQAWLLERLLRIYKNVDTSLDAFHAAYLHETAPDGDGPAVVLSTKYKDNDPFTYFMDADTDLWPRRIFAEVLSALKNVTGVSGGVFREHARSLIFVACEAARKELVDELTSQETFDLLSTVHVGASTNIWTVREKIMAREAMLNNDLLRIRAGLEESERVGRDARAGNSGEEETPAGSEATTPPRTFSNGAGERPEPASYTVARSGPEWTVRRT